MTSQTLPSGAVEKIKNIRREHGHFTLGKDYSRISFFLHARPRIVIIFWILVSAMLLIASISRELTSKAHEISERNPSLLEDVKRSTTQYKSDNTVASLLLTTATLICSLYFGTKSLLVLLALFISIIITSSLLHLTHSLIGLSQPVVFLLIMASSITVTNVLAVMKNWENSRRGPSTATINRLLLSTVDKSIIIFIWTTVTVSLLSLPAAALDPKGAGPSIAILIACIFIQNISSCSVLLCLLLIKHDCSLACPSDPRALVRSVAYRIEEKVIYVHHFLHSLMHTFLTSVAKYIILALFFTSGLSSIAMISYQMVQILEDSTNSTNTVNTLDSLRLLKTTITIFSIFLTPLPILLLSNRMRPFGLMAYLTVLHTLLVDATVQILMKCSFSALHNFLLLILAVDYPLRMSLQQAASRKRKLTARILDALDTQFSQTTMSMLIVLVVSAVGIMIIFDELWIHCTIISITSFLTTNFFLPASMIVIGGSHLCGIPPDRESIAVSESRSQYTDAQHISHIEMDRRSSAVTGIYKKRSFCSLPAETRRASMPVIMHHKANQRKWCDLAKKNRSMDSNGGMSPPSGSSSRIIMRKEPLLNSRGSLISNVSSLQSYIIKEEEPSNV